MYKSFLYSILTILICITLFSCDEEDLLIESENVSQKNKKNSILSFTPPNSTDSILCTDTLVYLALATYNDIGNPIEEITMNEVQYDPLTGYRHYYLGFLQQSGDTMYILHEYWDRDSGDYMSAGASKTYRCLGDDCCRVGFEFGGGGAHVCVCNGSTTEGNYYCDLDVSNSQITDISNGMSIFNNLNNAAVYLVTHL